MEDPEPTPLILRATSLDRRQRDLAPFMFELAAAPVRQVVGGCLLYSAPQPGDGHSQGTPRAARFSVECLASSKQAALI